MTTNGPSGQATLTALAELVEAATGPLERLALLRALMDAVDVAARETVAAARDARATWSEVGKSWQVSKQAAAKRFSQPDPDAVPAEPKPLAEPRKLAGYVVTTPSGRALLRIRRDR